MGIASASEAIPATFALEMIWIASSPVLLAMSGAVLLVEAEKKQMPRRATGAATYMVLL
jgi:hypothetical protein